MSEFDRLSWVNIWNFHEWIRQALMSPKTYHYAWSNSILIASYPPVRPTFLRQVVHLFFFFFPFSDPSGESPDVAGDGQESWEESSDCEVVSGVLAVAPSSSMGGWTRSLAALLIVVAPVVVAVDDDNDEAVLAVSEVTMGLGSADRFVLTVTAWDRKIIQNIYSVKSHFPYLEILKHEAGKTSELNCWVLLGCSLIFSKWGGSKGLKMVALHL